MGNEEAWWLTECRATRKMFPLARWRKINDARLPGRVPFGLADAGGDVNCCEGFGLQGCGLPFYLEQLFGEARVSAIHVTPESQGPCGPLRFDQGIKARG